MDDKKKKQLTLAGLNGQLADNLAQLQGIATRHTVYARQLGGNERDIKYYEHQGNFMKAVAAYIKELEVQLKECHEICELIDEVEKT